MLLIGLLFCCAAPLSAAQKIRFSDAWKFYRGDATGAQATGFNDASWTTVYLPHTVKEELNYRTSSIETGICWYRKSFTPSTTLAGKKVYLEFEAAMQRAQVWINGTSVITHLGGYTPFVVDISGYVKQGTITVVAVKLENAPSTEFPPGTPDPDFLYFGGLYRDVNMLVMDSLHITHPILANIPAGGGVFVTYPLVSTSSATVQVKTHVLNERASAQSCIVTTSILGADGAVVTSNAAPAVSISSGTASTVTQTLTVSSPKLWTPNTPSLYRVRSEVSAGAGAAAIDTMSTTIGIRSIAFSKTDGLQINGTRYRLRGCNRHQAYPVIGNAVPKSGQYRDAMRIKEFGYDFVRMSHYMQPESFVDACDKFGIASMACLPGWQYYNDAQAFRDNSVKALRDMIRVYRNHPSVIVYEAMHNESDPTAAFLNASKAAAHEEYPGNQMFTCGEEGGGVLDIYMSSAQHDVRSYTGTRACIISEYGDWEHGCVWADPITGCVARIERSTGEAAMLSVATTRASDLSLNRGCSWLTVDGVWTVFDYQAWSRGPYTGSGDMDIFRIPKMSAYVYQSQRNPSLTFSGVNYGPMVHIASQWTSTSATSLTVYSNCEQVRLYKNGTLVATNSPVTGTQLEHPQFKFDVAPFAAGNLRAEGLIGGTAKAWDTVFTPGAASKIRLAIDTAGLEFAADGSDIALVYASVVDGNGQVVPTAANSVTFAVSGPGTLVGTNPVAAVAGVSSILLRAGTTAGTISVTATTSGFSGSATVASHPVADPAVSIITSSTMAVLSVASDGSIVVHQKRDRISISIPGRSSGTPAAAVFTLFDARGRVVGHWGAERGTVSADIGSLPPGVYLGQFNDGVHRAACRVVR
jgi:beta-galactosidase